MAESLHGGDVWKHLRGTRTKLIDFSANVNPLGFSALVAKTIQAKVKTLIYYPEPGAQSLQKKLAQYHKIAQQNIAIGNGSIELIYLIPRALALKSVLIVVPTFSEYEVASRTCALNPIFFSLSAKGKFRVDLPRLISLLPDADLLFICNPNNPTARLWTKKELLALLAACKRHNTVLVIDEAFIDFSQDVGGHSLIGKVKTTDNLIIIRSLTKLYALAGLRIGYIAASKKLIKRISFYQYPWNVNSLALAVTLEVLKDKAYLRKTHKVITQERIYLHRKLKKQNGLEVYNSQANYFLCRLNKAATIGSAKLLKRKLLEDGILIRDCANFRGLNDSYFRVAIKTRSANRKLLAALDKTLE